MAQQATLTHGWHYERGQPIPAWPTDNTGSKAWGIVILDNDDSRKVLNKGVDVLSAVELKTALDHLWDAGYRNMVVMLGSWLRWTYYEHNNPAYVSYSNTKVYEPVNAAATFHLIHSNLSRFAHEMVSDYHEQSSLFDDHMMRHFDGDTLIPFDEQVRNRTFLEAFRIMLGTHWGRAHALLTVDPSVAANKSAWQAIETRLKAEHERLLLTCGQNGWPSLVKEEMPVDAVRAKLDVGQPFYFSPSAAGVWTAVDEANLPLQGEFEQRVAIDNFRLARREHSRHHEAFRFPAAPADVSSNIYPRQRAIMKSLRELYREIQTSHGHSTPNNSTANLKALMAMKLIYMTAMATLRERNDNDAALTKIEKNTTIGTQSFANQFKTIDSTLPLWLGVTEHWARRGFIYFDGGQFVRDSDGSSFNNEGPSNQDGDQRIGTHVQVIDLREIDHEINPVNLASGWRRSWLEQEYWEQKIAHELALTGVV